MKKSKTFMDIIKSLDDDQIILVSIVFGAGPFVLLFLIAFLKDLLS